ncbi:MAG: c-type cytochrome [Flavobacteriales bacterium]|jgi:cytochrome c peroxidase|nr:c-type cytochrome [Flavobacteriales bacterium]
MKVWLKTLSICPKNWLISIVLIVFVFHSCEHETFVSSNEQKVEKLFQIPSHFDPIPFPDDNHFTLERWQLGKKLFHDKRLSRTQEISCSSCHDSRLAFTKHEAVSPGILGRKGRRNAPTLTNIAYHPHLLFEASVPSIEMQVLVPIQDTNEFDHNMVAVYKALGDDPEYKKLSEKAYGRDFDAFVLVRSIANYERSMISANSKWDQVQEGKAVFTESERRGEALFNSEKTKCFTCHGGFTFTNFELKNNGLTQEYEDEGLYHFTHKPEDFGLFKVPTLRNIALTAPYMHDGSLWTLDEVITHYSEGVKPFKNKSPEVKNAALSSQEKKDLKAFLLTLTDSSFVNNSLFQITQ